MPELPEVETIKREIEKKIVGKKITGVIINNPRVIREPSPREFAEGLQGKAVSGAARKGKLLILELSGGKSLTVHLKMTGQFVYPGNGRSSRVSFRFSDGSILDFNDNRLFAELRLLDDWRSLKFVKELGPDPFELSFNQFQALFKNKKTKIKVLLLDQGFIAGIGNLYAAEILFAGRIAPGRPASSLSEEDLRRLYTAIREILTEAIKHHGSSVDNYVRLSGEQGGFVPYLKVYGREGKPCVGCKGTVKRIAMAGRGTYFCPGCQK